MIEQCKVEFDGHKASLKYDFETGIKAITQNGMTIKNVQSVQEYQEQKARFQKLADEKGYIFTVKTVTK